MTNHELDDEIEYPPDDEKEDDMDDEIEYPSDDEIENEPGSYYGYDSHEDAFDAILKLSEN